jgi:putative oxidoreductase
MFRKLVATTSNWAVLPLRLVLAAVFLAHGSQKVLGSFGGPGFNSFISGNTPFSFMRPTWLWLGGAAMTEFVGAILIFFGFLTRLAAFLLACVMLTAIIGVHYPAYFMPRGMEFSMVLLGISLSLLISGGGAASVDRALTSKRR